MFPDQEYAPARGSFNHAVLPPPFDPSASPTKTITVNCSWLPYIRGALQQLYLQATWDTDDPDVLHLAQMRAMTLVGLFDECSSLVLPFSCDFPEDDWATAGPFTLIPQPGGSPDPASVFTVNVGFTEVNLTLPGNPNTYRRAECRTTFSSRHITLIVMSYDLFKGLFTGPSDYTYIQGLLSGSVVFQQIVLASGDPDGSGKSLGWAGDQVIDEIRLFVLCDVASSGNTPSGFATILTCRIDGYDAASLCGEQ